MLLRCLLLTLAASVLTAQPPPLLLGVAWYPEQWPESRWDRDLQLMQDAGIRMARIGEFAWSSMDPREGQFTLDWMDRAVALAARHHIFVVLGTPTDAPPAWLTEKYPDTLRVDESGRPAQHGSRRHFSYTSPRYRELCRLIVDKMAARFGHNPNVLGWQIGNEYTDDSFDDSARRLFHQWLQAKYKTLDELNQRWATAYWSQTYDRWEQIPMGTGRQNPALLLDYKRFVTDQWRAFQRNQVDAIRARADRQQVVTTNLGGLGWADKFNRVDIAADLDFISWDDYVGQGHLEPYRNGATHDLVRGWKQRNFWVMETQPGSVNWAGVNNTLDPGETRAMAWEAVGHGADCVAYWQWRDAPNGQEQYHGALVGADGEPLPIYPEIRQVGSEFAKAAAALAGTAPRSEVAILHDYDSRWAIEFQPHSNRYDVVDVLLGYYRALRDATQSVDIVDPRAPLGGYKLVVAPSLNVLSGDLAAHLLDYVRRGGHLVLGPRSGMKDAFNALHPQRQPGPLAAPLGGRVEQFYALLDTVAVSGEWGEGKASIWAEDLSAAAPDTRTVLRYGAGNGWLEGHAAAIARKIGAGSITYIGALLDPNLMRAATRSMMETALVQPAFGPAPQGVEVCRRGSVARNVFVLINHNPRDVDITLPRPMLDILEDGRMVPSIRLAPQGVAVLQSEVVNQ